MPWSTMRAMRNVLAHEYFRLDALTIWKTATEDLPPLVPLLQAVLDQERNDH